MDKSILEKAEKLGVPIIQPVERLPEFPVKDQQLDRYKLMQVVEAICGGCGKELIKGQMRQPCGRQNCPFGMLANHVAIL